MDAHDVVKSWTKAALVLIAILIVVLALNKLLPFPLLLRNLFTDAPASSATDVAGLVLLSFTVVVLCGMAAVLMRWRRRIAARIIKPVSGISATWQAAAYRLAFLFAAVIVLFWAFSDLESVGYRATQLIVDEVPDVPRGYGALAWDGFWLTLIRAAIELSIGGYLLFGAPGLLKWQLRRRQTEDPKPTEGVAGALLESSAVPVAEAETLRTPVASALPFARLGFVSLALLAVAFAVKHLNGSVRIVGSASREHWETSNIFDSAAILLVAPLPLLLAAYVLVRHCDSLSRWIADQRDAAVPVWEKNSYQIAIVLTGVMIIAYLLPRAITGHVNRILLARYAPGVIDESFLPRGPYWVLAVYIWGRVAFGMFLLWAAPLLVKWQGKGTAEDP